jgi:hypothetical protein
MEYKNSIKFNKEIRKKERLFLSESFIIETPIRIDQNILNKIKIEEA